MKVVFLNLGSYNQTNGKSPEVNKNWCSGAETHGGDIQKQYETETMLKFGLKQQV